jgi:hypothetical protein
VTQSVPPALFLRQALDRNPVVLSLILLVAQLIHPNWVVPLPILRHTCLRLQMLLPRAMSVLLAVVSPPWLAGLYLLPPLLPPLLLRVPMAALLLPLLLPVLLVHLLLITAPSLPLLRSDLFGKSDPLHLVQATLTNSITMGPQPLHPQLLIQLALLRVLLLLHRLRLPQLPPKQLLVSVVKTVPPLP